MKLKFADLQRAPHVEGSRTCHCGQRISANKNFCQDCLNEAIERIEEGQINILAGKIDSQELLDQIMKDVQPQIRAGVVAKLLPHLPFSPRLDA